MLKKTFFVLALASFVAGAVYAAPDRTGRWDYGVHAAGLIPDDSESDEAGYIGGQVAYGVAPWLALGASAGWAEFDESDSGVNLEQTIVPVFGDIIFRIPMPDQPFQPYGIVGLGAIISDVDENVAAIDVDVETEFAAKVGGGIDWFINDHWIINFEGSYIMCDADAEFKNATTGAPIASVEGNMDMWSVGGGLKYLF
jgi:outer membrane protein W